MYNAKPIIILLNFLRIQGKAAWEKFFEQVDRYEKITLAFD
jgi:hypothetical protein